MEGKAVPLSKREIANEIKVLQINSTTAVAKIMDALVSWLKGQSTTATFDAALRLATCMEFDIRVLPNPNVNDKDRSHMAVVNGAVMYRGEEAQCHAVSENLEAILLVTGNRQGISIVIK